jgi:stearoyl-CoA desaturase (delta-9 desaturase)
MGWILWGETNHNNTRVMSKYAPDLAKHKFYVWLTNYHWVPNVILGAIVLVLGGIDMFLWAMCFRIVFGLHATWAVNSATHMFGSRRFHIRDDSRNTWWIALISFGEGWHNNHHAHPTSARHGLAWYELDQSWLLIKALKFVGLAKNVRVATVDSGLAEREAA